MIASRVFLASVLALAAAGPGAAPGPQSQEDTVYVEEVKASYLDKLRQLEERRDWKGFFDSASNGLRRFGRNLVRGEKQTWVGLSEYLLRRVAGLPPEAHEYYRLENDGRARAEFDRAREQGDRRLLEKAVDEFFFSSFADEGLVALGNLCFEEGALDEAVYHWNRLLRYYPGADVPPAVTAARIAHACAAAEDESALAELRRFVAERRLDGPVVVGNRRTSLGEYLNGVRVAPRMPGAGRIKAPLAHTPDEGWEPRRLGIRNEIRRWTYDFGTEAKEMVPAGVPQRLRQAPMPLTVWSCVFPAAGRVRERDYVILTDGTRIVAADPARVRGTSPSTGIYWMFPSGAALPRPLAAHARALQQRFTQPHVGPTLDGEHVYAAMFSPSRPADPNPQVQFQDFSFFEGPTSIKCFHVPTGKLVWDTDASPLVEEMRKLAGIPGQEFDFDQRRFAFSSPVLVRGGRIYVGLTTSPSSEQVSRVLCLDRKTGSPLWCTFLASVRGDARHVMMMMQGGRGGAVFQTLLAEQGGMVYAQTNLGAVAALDGVTGNIVWLAKYPHPVPSARNFSGYNEGVFSRPANWPLLWKGHLLVLPQDREDLLVYDRLTGRAIDIPPLRVGNSEPGWKKVSHLVGLVGDDLVAGGDPTHVVRLRELIRPDESWRQAQPKSNAHSLVNSKVAGGRGTIEGNFVYLGVSTGLSIYDANNWKVLDNLPWRGDSAGGNLLAAGAYLVVGAPTVSLYTDTETLKAEYVHRLHQSPPRAESLLEFGDVMRENQRFEEAAEAYLAFIRAAEGDPRHAERAGQVRGELHSIFLRRGEEAAALPDPALAFQHYSRAREFAPDAAAETEAIRRMAEQSEKLQRWKEAVALYQELIEKGRHQYYREAESVVRLWEFARRKIDAIVQKTPEAYAEVESRAAEALRKAGEGGAEAFRDVMDRFPNSGSAVEAWKKLLEAIRKDGKLEKLRSIFEEFKERFRKELDFQSRKELLDVLEKLGDRERLRFELARFAGRYGAERMGGGEGGGETAKEYAERRLREVEAPAEAAGRGPLAKRGEVTAPAGEGNAAARLPLRPAGVLPPGFAEHQELLAAGADVELWDLRENRRLWAFRPRGEGAPAESKPAPRIVGAAFTRDYALAVAWEDAVASIDLPTGRLLWRFADLREGQSVRAFHAADGRLCLYEGRRSDRSTARFSPPSGPGRARNLALLRQAEAFADAVPPPGTPGEHERLLCLNDSSGEVAWARAFESSAEQPGQATFLGAYLSEHAALLHWGPGGWQYLLLSVLDGTPARPRDGLPPQVMVHAADPSGRNLYYMASFGDQVQRVLRSLPLDPARKDYRPVEISLRSHLQQGHSLCSLGVGRDYLCVAAAPSPQASEYRILVYQAADGKGPRTVALPEGRTLPQNQAPRLMVDDDGLLYVYNVPREGAGSGADARASLTAFRLEREGAIAVAWDAPAPSMAPGDSPGWFVPVPPRYLVLATLRGRPPGQEGGTAMAAVYDKERDGYLAQVHTDLYGVGDGAAWDFQRLVSWWRGRLYVGSKSGLQVWGP